MFDATSLPLCSSCSRPPAVHPEHDASEAYKRCLAYSPIGRPGKRMMLVEREEHAHLLRLYEAVFNQAGNPSEHNAGLCRQRLEDCNRFFSGAVPCR